jgi:catalase
LKILNFFRKFKLKETGVNSMSQDPKKCPVTHLTTEAGAPVVDNQNSMRGLKSNGTKTYVSDVTV